MSKYIGLIGYPLKHSISPHFQQAALDYHGLDIRYEAWETTPEQLEVTIAKLREPQNLGANITVPLKEAVLPFLDQIDDLASLIGAVNTIVKRDNKLWGYNTDAHGFIETLTKQGDFEAEGKKVAILGAGGVARAVSFALVQNRIASILIVSRSLDRGRILADNLRKYTSQAGWQATVVVVPWQNLTSSQIFDACQLIVNCTTIGMKHSSQEGQSPLSIELIPKGVIVCDLVYNPYPTPLLKLAKEVGANILGGLPMLVYQGAASFELWMGREAPIDIMFIKANEMLMRQEQ
ncbi:MAG: shikimate dehydrogenase [Chloroflexota bacterium]|nr:shikimate dehydrogenase [Chloroflexota bacterium]